MNYLAQTYGTGVYSEQLDKGVNMIFTHFDRDYFLDMLDLTIGHITSGVTLVLIIQTLFLTSFFFKDCWQVHLCIEDILRSLSYELHACALHE